MKLTVRCPAKLNLLLAVGPRDARGYHPVRTVMQAVSLFDDLEIEFGAEGFTMECAALATENTVTKAIRLSREVAAVPSMRIHLVKRIPMEAGMGGGSSDAAGLLRALRYRRSLVSNDELVSVAAAVGMDTPFFLTGGRALGEGYGEVVTPLPDPDTQWYIIAKPPVGCSSAEMYTRLDAHRQAHGAAPPADWREGDPPFNDFQVIAPEPCVKLARTLEELGAQGAAMTGSGSAVFGRFTSEGEASTASTRLAAAFPDSQVWVARSLSRAESLEIRASP